MTIHLFIHRYLFNSATVQTLVFAFPVQVIFSKLQEQEAVVGFFLQSEE